jgi:hypothetical protein
MVLTKAVSLLNLCSDSVTIHHIRKLKEALAATLAPQRSPGGRGATVNMLLLIEELLRHRPPKDSTSPIIIKWSFDGCTVTSGQRIKCEIGTVEIITDRTASELKSYHNGAEWIVYFGEESHVIFAEEFKAMIPVLNKLIQDKKVNALTAALTS